MLLKTVLLLLLSLLFSWFAHGRNDTNSQRNEDNSKKGKWLFFGKEGPASVLVSETFVVNHTGDNINRTDENNLRQGFWVYYGKDCLESDYQPDGKIKEGGYIDDRKEGFWVKDHTSGVTPKLKGEYKNNRPCGDVIKYFQIGMPKEIGYYNSRKAVFSFHRYLEDGRIQEIQYRVENEPQVDFVFSYNENKCLDHIEVYKITENISETIIYSKYSCNVLKEKETIAIRADKRSPKNEIHATYEPSINFDTTLHQRYRSDLSLNRAYLLKEPDTVQGKYSTFLEEYAISGHDSVLLKGHRVYSKGQLLKTQVYNRLSNSESEIFIDGEFRDGFFRVGKVYHYDDDGILLRLSVYKDGSYFGEWKL